MSLEHQEATNMTRDQPTDTAMEKSNRELKRGEQDHSRSQNLKYSK